MEQMLQLLVDHGYLFKFVPGLNTAAPPMAGTRGLNWTRFGLHLAPLALPRIARQAE